MQLVLRPINDQFFEEIVFPVLEMGMMNSEIALSRLRPQLADPRVGVLVDGLLDHGAAIGTALWNLDQDLWLDTIHRLLFSEWMKPQSGWTVMAEYPGFASDWEQLVHVALMMDSPHYPYDDAPNAQRLCKELTETPGKDLGLASFFAGVWNPCPRFPAHEVLSVIKDRGIFKAGELCMADWSYRSATTVALWTQQLPTKLGRLLRREETRLNPVPIPEKKAILDYWTGVTHEPPQVAVAFSGLGPESQAWIRSIGEVAQQIRSAAEAHQGLSMIITHGSQTFEEQFL